MSPLGVFAPHRQLRWVSDGCVLRAQQQRPAPPLQLTTRRQRAAAGARGQSRPATRRAAHRADAARAAAAAWRRGVELRGWWRREGRGNDVMRVAFGARRAAAAVRAGCSHAKERAASRAPLAPSTARLRAASFHPNTSSSHKSLRSRRLRRRVRRLTIQGMRASESSGPRREERSAPRAAVVRATGQPARPFAVCIEAAAALLHRRRVVARARAVLGRRLELVHRVVGATARRKVRRVLHAKREGVARVVAWTGGSVAGSAREQAVHAPYGLAFRSRGFQPNSRPVL